MSSGYAIAAPIKADRLDDWKEWSRSMTREPKRSEFVAFMKSTGVSRVRCWLQQGPQGPLGIIVYDGETPMGFGQALATSQDPFAVWFRGQVLELHGMDMTNPPGDPSELISDTQ